MTWSSSSPVGLALVITGFTLAFLASVAWRRRHVTRGARSLTFLMLSGGIWALLEALQAIETDPQLALTWRQLRYVGVAGLPVAYLVFAHDYSRGSRWLNRYAVALLLVVPSITVALAWTNPLHGLMWVSGAGAPPAPIADLPAGGWFWIHTSYSYALLGLGSFYLVRGFLRTPRTYRAQVGWVLLAVLIPWAANIAVVVGGVDAGGADVTPLAFALSAFAFARSLFSHRLLDIVPVAQEEVVRPLADAVIVTDEFGRTLQANPAAAQLLGLPDADAAFGRPLSELLHDVPALDEALSEPGPVRFEAAVLRPGVQGTFDVQVTLLTDRRGRATGRLVRLHDIERQVQAERTLALAETALMHQEAYVLALQEVTEGLMRRAPLAQLLEAVVRHACEVMEAPHGFLDLIDAHAGMSRRERARGRFVDVVGTAVRPGEGLTGRAWVGRAPLRVDDYARWEGRLRGVELDWVRAAVAAPLTSREGVLGVMVVARAREDRRPFQPTDEAQLARFAELAALAVLNVRLIDELEARRRESEQLARIGNAMQEASGVEERMALVLQAIPRVVGLRRAAIWLPDESDRGLEASAWVGFDEATERLWVPLDGSVPLLQEAYQHGRATVIEAHEAIAPSLRARPPYKDHPLVRSRAVAVVPLVARGAVVGVLAADTPAESHPVSASLEVLHRFATSAAIAIDAAKLLATAQAEVADRRAAESQLRRSEEKYRSILEQMEEAYFETDLQGRCTLVNPSLLRNLGVTAEQVLGRSFRHLVHPDEVRRVVEVFGEVARSGRSMLGFEVRYRNRRLDTTARAEMSVSLVRDAAGAPAGFRGVVRDIEERARHQEELRTAKEAAEAANASKSVFLANVSHELRTPLTSILGFARLIERRVDEVLAPHLVGIDNARVQRALAQVHGNAGIISRESRRLTSLINAVLDLAKIEAGKVEWHMEQLAPRDVVEQALEATSGLLDAKPGVRVRSHLDAGVPDVIGDRDRLVQVLINLLSNAVKFTAEGEVVVRLFLDAGEVLVSVRDTGVGIAPEDHEAVFEQFRQAGDTLTEKPQGTGLGLPICRQIVAHHGGRLWLESVLGQGSTFTVALPPAPWLAPEQGGTMPNASIDDDVNVAAGTSPGALGAAIQVARQVKAVLARPTPSDGGPDELAPTVPVAPNAPVRVLVVEDDAHARGLLRETLEASGHTVSEAADAAAAVRAIDDDRPDLVFLGVAMSHLSGFDIAAALADDPDVRGMLIVALSPADEGERGRRLSVERYLSAPSDAGGLVKEVAALLPPSEADGEALTGARIAFVDDADDVAAEHSLTLRAEAALRSARAVVSRVSSVSVAAELEPVPVLLVLSRAAAARDDGLALARRHPRLRDATILVRS